VLEEARGPPFGRGKRNKKGKEKEKARE